MTPHIQSTQGEPPRHADSRERSWLVFRLGPHVMCASALDVEGIIERPRVITTLPVMPEYALGAFLFRDHSAMAISLRRKLKVREGEDSVKGPFIAARVREAIFAFWVDEVKDVIEEKGTEWRPMPEMLAGGLFDRFAIREGELILHTSFAALLEAEVEIQSVAGWAAKQIDSGATPVPVPVVRPAASDTALPLVGAASSDAHERRTEAPLTGAGAPDTAPQIVETSSEAKAGNAAADVPGSVEVREVRRPVPAPEAPFQSATAKDAAATRASGVGGHRESRDWSDLGAARRYGHGDSGISTARPMAPPPGAHPYPRGRAAVPSSARPGVTGNAALEDLSAITSRSIYEADRRPRSSARYWFGGAVLAIAVLAAMVYSFSPGFRGDARQSAASTPPATSTTRDTAPQTPATAADAARDAATRAVASPKAEPAPQQIVSIKSEALTLTVERPAGKDAQPGVAKPDAAAGGAAGRPADPNTRTHVVVRGDTLWDIAKTHVGDPYRYPELAEFSNIRNPDLIYPGDIVRIEIRDNRK